MAGLFRRIILAVAHHPVVERIMLRSRAGRHLARRFVPGTTLDDAVAACRLLNDRGMSVSLDHLGEEVKDEAAAHAARADYVECIERIAAEGLDANLSVKLTQLGLGVPGPDALVEEAITELAEAARRANTTVTIDMEDSRWTQATVDLYAALQPAAGNLGLALQAALYRTPADLERVITLGGHIRICKGAYLEPPEVAAQRKDEVDLRFAAILHALLAQTEVVPAVATHDERLVDLTRDLARDRTAPFEFQMLYGIRTDLQHQLVDAGCAMRVYVPYGPQWYPYLTRRLAERPANLLFFLQALRRR